MKHDCFYEGLNPKYQQMLPHKVDGEYPASYSSLLLAAQKLERWAEARDPLPSKTATAGRLNATHSQTSGNLCSSQKLKGNHTFTAQSATVGNNKAEEDPCVKPEREGEAESSAGEDLETSSEVGRTNQSVGYIIHYANAVKLYPKKNQNCFRCGSSDHFMRDYLKDLNKTTWKVCLNVKEGMTKKEGQAPQKPIPTQQASPNEAPQA